MLNVKDVFDKIRQKPVTPDPFVHLVVDNLLPDEFYKKLSVELDKEDFPNNYIKGPYGNRGRYGVDLTDYYTWKHSGKRFPTTLQVENYNSLASNGSENIKIFIDFLIEHEKELYSLLCSKMPTERIQDDYFFHISMNKDSVGYEIPPHTDDKENIYTILFYAPETDVNKNFGLHMQSEKVDFIPNRLLVFAPSKPNSSRKATWHEVKLLTDKMVGTRNSFQMFFMQNKRENNYGM